MGSPISVTLAEIVMQQVEETALSHYHSPPPFWYRYVDDCITALPARAVPAFLEHLNSIEDGIRFTVESEERASLPFLDTLVSRGEDGSLSTSVYRKPTHTDRLLHFGSYHPATHKAAVVRTLHTRATNICSDEETLQRERHHLKEVFRMNNYPVDFVEKHRVGRDREATRPLPAPLITVAAPYYRGTSETIARLLKPHGIRLCHRPVNTLRSLLMKVKDPTPQEERPGTIYKIPCQDCPAAYIGETGRSFNIRKTEHRRSVNRNNPDSLLVEHINRHGHNVDWDSGSVIDQCNNRRGRLVIEAWHTNRAPNTINRCIDLPDVYRPLIKK